MTDQIKVLPLPLIALLGLVVFPNNGFSDDWYRWRGPNLDGLSVETEWRSDWPEGQVRIAWRIPIGIGFSSVVVSNQRAFTIGHVEGQDIVYAVNVNDGSIAWQFGYPAALDDRDFEGGPTSTPTVDGDRLFVFSRAGELFCLDIRTGDPIWKTSVAEEADVRLPGWGCAAAPMIVGDRVLLNIGEAGAAVNKATGKVLWSSDDREAGYATPVIIPDSEPAAAMFASGKSYIAVEIESGRQLWSQRWLTSFNCNAADPIFFDGRLFLSSGYNRGAALFDVSSSGVQQVWKSKEMKNQIHSSLLYQNYLYGIDGDMEAGARLRCMDWESGDVKWSQDDLRPGGLTIAGDRLIVLTESGDLIVAPATAKGWKPSSRCQIGEGKYRTSPVLSNGRVYCRSIQGELVCIDCRP
ncbi:MAG: PQQ-binding-like beta-propeller repeat protein [Planctomycetota bacterium]